VEGRAVGVSVVLGRVAPGCPYPRSLEGFLVGALPVLIRLFAPALGLPGAVDGRVGVLLGAVPVPIRLLALVLALPGPVDGLP
jgi:hypothetical protein